MSEYIFPPGPKYHLPGGAYIAVYRDLLGFMEGLVRDHGDIVHVKFGHQHAVLLNHPDYVQEVLVTHAKDFTVNQILKTAQIFLGRSLLSTDGDFHLHQRRLMQPLFLRQRVAGHTEVMVKAAQHVRDRWQENARLDIAHEMMQVTLGVAGRALVGVDMEALSDEFNGLLVQSMRFVSTMTALPFGRMLEHLPLPATHHFHQARARLEAIVQEIIDRRRRGNEQHDDILHHLLQAQKENGWLTDTQVRDELLTLLLAGHETTATGLSWTWYLLSQNPQAEARLHAEVDGVLDGRPPTADDVPKLRYTEMAFAEAIRIYPPAWIISRPVLRDFEIGGYRLPTGTTFYICQYLLHRHRSFYPDPLKYDPERMSPEARAARPHYAYIPFSAGPHQCIGEQFAWHEAVLVLATIAQKWRLRAEPDYVPELEPLITLVAKGGLPMTVERRN
jgi:cytochrome P450